MIKFENTGIVGWEHTIRGMRNPMNSWEKGDSEPGCEIVTGSYKFCRECDHVIYIQGQLVCDQGYKSEYVVGFEDLELMKRLRNAGTDHRKFMRMIVVYVDIVAPLYWWKEFDTYKIGTVANSCSTMHKIAAKEFTLGDFSCEHLSDDVMLDIFQSKSPLDILYSNIDMLNLCRQKYLETKDKKYWWQMIQLLPSSYNQRRTVMLNYEVLANIYKSRQNHKLDEWSVDFMEWIKSLPYSRLITGDEGDGPNDE